jgi:hypothetical protein
MPHMFIKPGKQSNLLVPNVSECRDHSFYFLTRTPRHILIEIIF